MKRIYFDNAATTSLDPLVLEAMMPYFTVHFGNPSSIYSYGRETRLAIENARKSVARILNAHPAEIFFTSGGTESSNTAILAAVRNLGCRHIISSVIEHHATLHTTEYLFQNGEATLSHVRVLPDGHIDMEDLEKLLATSEEKCLVTLMHANNEIGNMLDIQATGELQAPTHPELLDLLATEFVARGWSVKAMHRFIMTSNAYQRGGLDPHTQDLAKLTELDPENRLLSYFPRRRLEGEAVWDAMHAVAGTLNLEMGGPPFAPPLSEEEYGAMRYRHQWVIAADPRQHTRRGVYMLSIRTYRFPLFDIFDAPTNSVSTGSRDISTVAPQALWLLNNPRALKQAQHLAARVVRDTGDNPEALVIKLWRIVLGRHPTPIEKDEALALLNQLELADTGQPIDQPPVELASLPAPRAAALVKLAVAMFNHNEFLLID